MRPRPFGIGVVPLLALACASKGPVESVFEEPVARGPDSSTGSAGSSPKKAPTTSRDTSSAAPIEDDAGSDAMLLHPQCSPREPFMCPDSSGKLHCSSRPCLPDCTRVGCVGGEECKRCTNGSYQCVASGGGC
jgi:hypothetical protein